MSDSKRDLVLRALGKTLYKYPDVAANTGISIKETLEIMRGLILEAIDAHKHTLPQIKKHFGISMSFDISSIIEGMFNDDLLVRVENFESIKGFFRTESAPDDFLVKDGTCEPIYKKVKKQEPAKPPTIKEKILGNLELLEQFARDGKTKKAFAQHLEIDERVFCKVYFYKFPGVKEAWQKGKDSSVNSVRQKHEAEDDERVEKAKNLVDAAIEALENGFTKESVELATEAIEATDSLVAEKFRDKRFDNVTLEDVIKADCSNIPVTPEEDEAFEELSKNLDANAVAHKIETDKEVSGDYLGETSPTKIVSDEIDERKDESILNNAEKVEMIGTPIPGLKHLINPNYNSFANSSAYLNRLEHEYFDAGETPHQPKINHSDFFEKVKEFVKPPSNHTVLNFEGNLTVELSIDGNMFDAPKNVRDAIETLISWSQEHKK